MGLEARDDFDFNSEFYAEEVAELLIYNYPQVLSHVDIDKISFEYFESDRGPTMTIEGLNPAAISLLSESDVDKRYIIGINLTNVAELDPIKLQWMVLDMLLSIHRHCNGQIKPHAFKSHTPIVNAICQLNLGAEYLSHPDLPDLIHPDIEIPIF